MKSNRHSIQSIAKATGHLAFKRTKLRWLPMVIAVLGLALLTLNSFGAEPTNTLRVIPEKISLNGPAAHQQLLLERSDGKHFTGQLTNGYKIWASEPKVLRVDGDRILPVTNGTARIMVSAGSETASAEVQVTGMEKPFEWSFRNHVQPVLARFGCSSGACHGAAAGQNGFKLSLRGYDDEGDYLALTHHAFGRRIVPSDPGRSLLLLKPTGAVPHKGGVKFDTGSLEYRVLSEWIAAGTPPPRTNDPRIVRIEILPEQVMLKPGLSQQLLVRAHFNDGHVEDVTRWAKYTSANESVAQVNEQGATTVSGYGEGAVTAWYLSRIAIATITAPYTNSVTPETFAKAPRRNFIDDLVLEKLQSLNLPPSPRCSDEEFIRRAFIDTLGILPTVKETREFLDSQSAGKRDDLIQQLLKRPEFVDYWTYKWADLLLVQSRKLRPAAMWSYYNWIRNNVAANTPWNQMVRQLVTSQGSTLENGAANFFVLHEDPKLMAETTSQAFLGMSINCARCHNHPMEKWTNDEYFGFANLFARLRSKTGTRDGENIIFASTSGDVVQPLTGKPQPPRPLEGKPLPIAASTDRRLALADWLISPENPYFSRSIVNRVWANFFGVGLVENVDDLRVTNPASNEKLLSATGKYLAQEKFDLKTLMRTILESETYQRASTALAGNAADTRFYSRYYPRRLTAEVLLDTLSEASGAPTAFKGYPTGWRALQLPDSNVDSYFLKTFGRPDREKTCECERSTEPSVTQVLHMSNGDTVNQKLSAKNNRITQLVAEKAPPEKIIEEAYLSALSRYPSETERNKFLQRFQDVAEKDRRPLIEDVYWALLTSKEFLFNH